jgi:hypothetical protein
VSSILNPLDYSLAYNGQNQHIDIALAKFIPEQAWKMGTNSILNTLNG